MYILNACEAHPCCCFALLLIHAGGCVLLLRRNLVKENKGVWRRRIYRKYASCRWLRTRDSNLRADVVKTTSARKCHVVLLANGCPRLNMWESAIFVRTSGIPPKIIHRSVKSYKIEHTFWVLELKMYAQCKFFLIFCAYHRIFRIISVRLQYLNHSTMYKQVINIINFA